MAMEFNIRWQHLILFYVHSSAAYRRLGNLANVGECWTAVQ